MTTTKSEVPLSLTEKFIERHYTIDPMTGQRVADAALDVVHGAVQGARKAAEACVAKAAELRANRLNSEIANELAVARASHRYCEGPRRELIRVKEKVESTIGELVKATSASPAELDRISRLKRALNDLDRADRLFETFVHGIADQDAVRKAEELESRTGRGSAVPGFND
jgi:hypothetical protein